MTSETRLLLLSNSRNHGQGYLEHALEPIARFLGPEVRRVAFVPYAGVTVGEDAYAALVRERFESIGYELISVHETHYAHQLVDEADAIAVGGGNTFRLLQRLRETGLLYRIRHRVVLGTPYIGWSAGSNMACPTLRTTNDMPIVDPGGFDALGLIPFQINPHYLDAHPEGHQGETREQRILEFIALNPDVFVVGLREGSILQVAWKRVTLLGDKPVRIFRGAQEPVEIGPDGDLDFLCSG